MSINPIFDDFPAMIDVANCCDIGFYDIFLPSLINLMCATEEC
jgi:hypothetical protein